MILMLVKCATGAACWGGLLALHTNDKGASRTSTPQSRPRRQLPSSAAQKLTRLRRGREPWPRAGTPVGSIGQRHWRTSRMRSPIRTLRRARALSACSSIFSQTRACSTQATPTMRTGAQAEELRFWVLISNIAMRSTQQQVAVHVVKCLRARFDSVSFDCPEPSVRVILFSAEPKKKGHTARSAFVRLPWADGSGCAQFIRGSSLDNNVLRAEPAKDLPPHLLNTIPWKPENRFKGRAKVRGPQGWKLEMQAAVASAAVDLDLPKWGPPAEVTPDPGRNDVAALEMSGLLGLLPSTPAAVKEVGDDREDGSVQGDTPEQACPLLFLSAAQAARLMAPPVAPPAMEVSSGGQEYAVWTGFAIRHVR
eukprot:Hpha_TRINITY_DN1588_c0_g1::TRINITY_DN1588_c0_g1_i2::g.57105::m.57105